VGHPAAGWQPNVARFCQSGESAVILTSVVGPVTPAVCAAGAFLYADYALTIRNYQKHRRQRPLALPERRMAIKKTLSGKREECLE
jgi:hypothetical protein